MSGANSVWHFQGVDVIALSLDWFRNVPDGEQLQQPGPRVESSSGVHVSMSDCVLRSMKCATPSDHDMARSWLTTISGGDESAMQVGENVIGSIADSGWVDVAPWAATSPTVMFRFQNTSTACTPVDDPAMREMVLSGHTEPAHAPTDTCYHANDHGQTYRGKLATTKSGRACLQWGLSDQPAGGNIFADPLLHESGLESNACRNPLGMLDRPWCFIADAPYIEHCAVDVCPQPVQQATANAGGPAPRLWINVLVVICSIAGVLLIALLLVLLMRAIWGGSLCPTGMSGSRKQGRSKREGNFPQAKQSPNRKALDSVSTEAAPMSELDEVEGAEESPAGSAIHSNGSGRKLSPGSEFVSTPPVKPRTRSRPQSQSSALAQTSSPKPASQGAVPPSEVYRRFSELQGGAGSARLNSMGGKRSSTGDGRSTASSRGLRPNTPPLHKTSSSQGEIRSQGSPMHQKHRRTSSIDHGYLEWQLIERPSDMQPGSSRSRGDETGSVNEERTTLIASPTLQQIMQRSKTHRKDAHSVGAAGVLEPNSKRNSGSGKSPREGDLRQRTIEEDLSHLHGVHDAVHRGNTYSVDSRSYATSSLQDVVNSAGFASGAVNSGAVAPGKSNTGRYGANDMQHNTEGSTIVLDTTLAVAADTHHTHHSGSTAAADHTPRDRLHLNHQQYASGTSPEAARAAAAAAMVAGVQTSWVAPYRRPDTECTISGSWTNSNSSPTGTLASRVAMQFPAGASFNTSAADGAVGLETFQSDRDSHTSHYQVNLWEHDIKLGKRLGRGSFAQVFQGLWNDTAVAIKVIEYKEGARDAVDPCMEASLTKELTHPNVVITYDYGWTSHEINSLLSVRPESIVMVILMEYCNLKSLATNIRHTNRFGHQGGTLKWTPISHTLIDILRGLMYLHDMDIIHGDIKAANVMLKSVHKTVSPVKFTAKLADLGLAQLRGDAVSAGAVGSLTHAAPELLNSRCNTPQSDVYAFGVLMYEIISGKEPFKGLSVTDLIRVKTTTHTADTLVLKPGDDPVYSAFAEIFHQCVASEPADRPTCKQLFKQLRTLSANCGLSSHTSTAHYQSIRVCPDSCSSPSKDMLALSGAKAASLASVSTRYSRSPRSPRSTDAASAAQLWATQGGLTSEHGPYSQRRNMHWGTSSPGFQQSPLNMRSQMSPRTMSARSGWRSPSATSPHSPHTSHHGSPARSPRPDHHPFSYDYARPPTDDPAFYGLGSTQRSNTPASMSGAMSPTHSEHAMLVDTRRFEPARSGSVASSVHDTNRSLGPSTQTELGTFERGNTLSARQRAHSAGVLSSSLQPGVPSPRVAYRQTHMYPTGSPAIASSEAVSPGGRAASASNSPRTLLGLRESGLEPSSMSGLRPHSADQYSEMHSSVAGHGRLASGVLSPSAAAQYTSPPGSLDVSAPGTALYNNSLFTDQAGGLSANDAGDDTAPEDGDSSSEDSPRGNSRGGQRLGNDNSEMAATQAALGGLDSADSFGGRRDLNLGSVDSFNLEMGNSSNLQRLMRDHNPPGKGSAALGEPASGPSGGPSGISMTLDDRRVVGTTIPEASATECTLDAIPSVSAIRRNSGNSANTRLGGLRRPGLRGNGQRWGQDGENSGGGPVEASSASAAHLTSTITGQSSSGTVSLNLWGNNNSLQNSMMHDESPQGQALAGAGDASFSTDADAYPVQSIMDSMRHMHSVAGNSSFMRRTAGDQAPAERSAQQASLLDAQPALLNSTSPANSGNPVSASGGAATCPDNTQSVPSMSNDGTTQSSALGENTGNLPDGPWARSVVDASKQSGNDAPAAEQGSSLSASNLQPAPSAQQSGGEPSLLKVDKPVLISSAAGLQSETHTNVLSTSSISCGPVPVAGDRVGLSPASRPHSGGTHTVPVTSRTGSLSQTLSHNSLSSPLYMHTNVLNKPALAAGMSAMHRELSTASLAHAPAKAAESISATRVSPDAVSLATSHPQRSLKASMLQPAVTSAAVGFKPFGANRMDVQAWLQDVPDPSDARMQSSPPTSPAGRQSQPRRHSLPVDQSSVKGNWSAGLSSGNPIPELKDAVAARQFEHARQRLTTASALRGSSRKDAGADSESD